MSAFKSDMLFLLIILAIIVSIASGKFVGDSDNSKMLIISQGNNTINYDFKTPTSPKEGVVTSINKSKFKKFIKTKDGHVYVYNDLICSINGVPLDSESYVVNKNNNYVIRYQTLEGKHRKNMDCSGIYPVVDK